MAGRENVGHRGVKCFASVSGAAGTAGSQGAAAAALVEAHVVISFLVETAVAKGVDRRWRLRTPALPGARAGPIAGRLEVMSRHDADPFPSEGRQG